MVDFFRVVWSECEERIKMLTIGKSVRGIALRSIFLRRFYGHTVLQRKIFSLFLSVHDVISQMIGQSVPVFKLKILFGVEFFEFLNLRQVF